MMVCQKHPPYQKLNIGEKILLKISEHYPDLLTADGFDEAIIGVVERIGLQAICYDKDKVIDILVERDGMEYDEAIEYFDFNIAGAWVGEATPFFLERMEL